MNANAISILFVCEGNSCRSVMAEAFAKRHFGATAMVRSAGFDPKPEYDSRSAVRTLKEEFGIDASGHRQTHIRDVDIDAFIHLIAMNPEVGRNLRALTPREIVVWNIDDPWAGDAAEYRLCALQILHEFHLLLPRLFPS